jgi:very-short-patch-repair endonuclease
MTDAERRLWMRVRGKQILDVQFYRQKPLGEYIVDFYAPKARLIVEVDGGQHFEPAQASYDEGRSRYLSTLGRQVVRFTNFEVLTQLDAAIEEIFGCVRASKNPP